MMRDNEKNERPKKRGFFGKLVLFLNISLLIANTVFFMINAADYKKTQVDKENPSYSYEYDVNGIRIQTDSALKTQSVVEVGRTDFSWIPESTETRKIIALEYMSQNDYPTGCESVTACMALKYMGYDISVDDFIDKYLPKYDPIWKGDVMYAEDPNRCFIGNPRSSSGYGCFAGAIESALISSIGVDAIHNLSGLSIDNMIEMYVSKGIPVILWGTINMSIPYEGVTWKVERTGQTFTWIGGEHCLLLAGWDEKMYYFYDPYKAKGIVGYDKDLVNERYNQMGQQALAIVKVKK